MPDDDGNIVHIAERNSMHAMNGDRVRVQLLAKRRRSDTEGAVIEILERDGIGSWGCWRYSAISLSW